MSLLAALGFGFLLGLKHACDPDHVVAVSTLVSRKGRGAAAWLLGAVWGLGHTATVIVVGAAIALLKLQVSARVGLSFEFCVGVVLVVLGVLNTTGLLPSGVTVHSHGHEHAHVHTPEGAGWLSALLKNHGRTQVLRSAFVGVVHGLAGSAAVALLASAAMPAPREAVLYLAVFGAGTVAGMLVLSAAMERSMSFVASWWTHGDRALSVAAGLLSLAFGALIVYQTAFSDSGLLSAAPVWTPR